ncbi:MAG: GHKL domain-containing protein [Flavisolibacter sp.]|nr:GHKL domain-containing protein [Flavisolibacter sp.]
MVSDKEKQKKHNPEPRNVLKKSAETKTEEAPAIDYLHLANAARWLRFPPAIETEFASDYYNNTINTSRIAFLCGFIFYALFGILDIYIAPVTLNKVWLIRFGLGCPALVLVLLFSYIKRFASSIQLLACMAATIGGIGVDLIIYVTRPEELANSQYYAGIILVILFTSAWLRLRFWYALIANTITIIGYEIVAISVQKLLLHPEGQLVFLSNNYILISAYIIGMFTCYSLERHSRMDFLQKRAIEAEKNKSNAQRIKIEQQAKKLKKAVVSLKKTQTRLVHSEKLASLGELTAGIAHEIRNPLNFVNNFSEISMELMEDMEKELSAGNKEEIISLADNIKENLQKIAHHGKRADSIIKNMLQHSRKGTGVKEPTEINVLADEYLHLSYQGYRARDKNFNASMELNLDQSIGKINVVAQDIGRVLLNLFNNAFYSVNEKKKQLGDAYNPVVSVQTKKVNDFIEIHVRDNGTGIPQKVMDKIYQPFFTTKPAGEGVGLGLSLSHDIITKGHGGSLHIDTKEGEFAEFIIRLPA